MHQKILSKNQVDLLKFIESFSANYYLVGGTAIALQIGHRRSIDFDLFTKKEINFFDIQRVIKKFKLDFKIRYQDKSQISGSINDVQITFYQYPFNIVANTKFLEHDINMPDLFTLSSMKAYALGRRAKWKDYVDTYFLLKNFFSFDEVCQKAEEIFGGMFSRKLFRQQLSFFDDVDYREKVEYVIEPIPDEEIKKYLTDVSTEKIA